MTEVLMSKPEVLALLTETGAIREGHFKLPGGEHTNYYFQLPLALRYYNYARRLSVGLSRLLRLVPEVAAQLPNISIVGASIGGIPVAYGVREALQADQIMWAEKGRDEQLHFRQYDEVHPGENCVLVDDLMFTGRTMKSLMELVAQAKGKVLAACVLVDPCIGKIDLGNIPLVRLAEIPTLHFPDSKTCAICKDNKPLTPVQW